MRWAVAGMGLAFLVIDIPLLLQKKPLAKKKLPYPVKLTVGTIFCLAEIAAMI